MVYKSGTAGSWLVKMCNLKSFSSAWHYACTAWKTKSTWNKLAVTIASCVTVLWLYVKTSERTESLAKRSFRKNIHREA